MPLLEALTPVTGQAFTDVLGQLRIAILCIAFDRSQILAQLRCDVVELRKAEGLVESLHLSNGVFLEVRKRYLAEVLRGNQMTLLKEPVVQFSGISNGLFDITLVGLQRHMG